MIYGNKHVVFEQVGVDDTKYRWNITSNVDGDGCSNNYEISEIRNTLSSTILPKLSDELTSELVSTTIQTSKNSSSTTLISTDDKLFISASKEVGYSMYSMTYENNALTTWTYWTTHTTSSNHIKYDSTSTAQTYWNRSPRTGNINDVCEVSASGGKSYNSTDDTRSISSCFAW